MSADFAAMHPTPQIKGSGARTSLLNIVQHVLLMGFVAAIASPNTSAVTQRSIDPGPRASRTIPEAWPAGVRLDRLSDIGRGKAVIFSPDIAVQGNREFYEGLGFLYVEEASWTIALNKVIARNYWHPDDRVETIFIETHGTNGDGLKLQSGPGRTAARSYISIAALQERLGGTGVRLCVVAACNAGRLFRPEYTTSSSRNRSTSSSCPRRSESSTHPRSTIREPAR